MNDSRQVWIVEIGIYSSRYVEGVYSTIEHAIAANPVERPAVTDRDLTSERDGGWKMRPHEQWHDQDVKWWNGLDHDDCAMATPHWLDGNEPG